MARSDEDIVDETIQLSFGDLPPGVAAGEPDTATVTIYDTPAAPEDLRAEGGPGRVTLRWTDPANDSITGWEYLTRRLDRPWGSWTAMAGGDDLTGHALGGLDNGVRHFFQVPTHNARGYGPPSATVSASPSA